MRRDLMVRYRIPTMLALIGLVASTLLTPGSAAAAVDPVVCKAKQDEYTQIHAQYNDILLKQAALRDALDAAQKAYDDNQAIIDRHNKLQQDANEQLIEVARTSQDAVNEVKKFAAGLPADLLEEFLRDAGIQQIDENL